MICLIVDFPKINFNKKNKNKNSTRLFNCEIFETIPRSVKISKLYLSLTISAIIANVTESKSIFSVDNVFNIK